MRIWLIALLWCTLAGAEKPALTIQNKEISFPVDSNDTWIMSMRDSTGKLHIVDTTFKGSYNYSQDSIVSGRYLVLFVNKEKRQRWHYVQEIP